ncbi:MAG: hypothetical protein ACI4I5_08820 [Acutalibacteraceae bacterium]
MAKRKLGTSVIILMIAAITLVSGTYAWFMVGGFASLFNIGFDVIQAEGGILLQGDAGTSNKGTAQWGDKLEREDFTINSFIVSGGKYLPISSTNGVDFKSVNMKDGKFINGGQVTTKATATDPNQMHYNDFTFKMKSDGAVVSGGDAFGAYMTISLSGDKEAEDGTITPGTGAETAARAAVYVDGVLKGIYSSDGESYSAVTNYITDGIIVDTVIADGRGNQIIDDGDTNAANAALVPVTTKSLVDEANDATKIYIGKDLPESTSTDGVTVNVKIWLEGNDKDCVDKGANAIAGKSLMAVVNFGVDAA